MTWYPPTNGFVLADVEEDKKRRHYGGDNDIEGEYGK
jgi:hypothetical protein